MKKEDLKIGAVIGFEVGGDGYVTALIYALLDGQDAVAAYVGKDYCNGVSTMTLGYLHVCGDDVVTYNCRDVDLISPDYLDMDANDGLNDYGNIVNNILAMVQGRKSDYSTLIYEKFEDEDEHRAWLDLAIGRLKANLQLLLKANEGFKKEFERIKATRNRCPVCGGRTSAKKVEEERRLRECYAELSRGDERKDEFLKSLNEKNSVLEKSNKLMSEELDRLRIKCESLSVSNNELKKENEYLKSRGFWDRLFNR